MSALFGGLDMNRTPNYPQIEHELCPECHHPVESHSRSVGCMHKGGGVIPPLCRCLAAPPFIGSLAPIKVVGHPDDPESRPASS